MQRFSTTTRSAPSQRGVERRRRSAAWSRPTARPGRRWSTGPSPATVRTVQPWLAEHPRPGRRHHRDPVVTPEPERHEGDLGHGGTLPTVAALTDAVRPLLEAAWRDDAAGRLLRAERHDLPVAVAVGQLLPRGGVGAPRRRASDRRAAQRAVGAGRRRLRAPPPLRRRAVPARGAVGPAGVVDDHPAADVRARGRRARPPRDGARRRGGRASRSAGSSSSSAGGGAARAGWSSSATRGSRAATTAPGGTTPCRAGARRRRGSTRKGELVASIERTPSGAPLHNPAFAVGSVGLQRARRVERARAGDGHRRRRASWRGARELADAIDARWDAELVTWVDDGPTAAGSGRIRTLDALLPSLRAPARRGVRARCSIPAAYGAPCGPRGVHAAEPTYEPAAYWRGSAWPQLTYLLWLAATSSGSDAAGSALVRSIVAGRGALRVRGALGGRHRRAARGGAPDLVDARAGGAQPVAEPRAAAAGGPGGGSARAPRRRRRRSR